MVYGKGVSKWKKLVINTFVYDYIVYVNSILSCSQVHVSNDLSGMPLQIAEIAITTTIVTSVCMTYIKAPDPTSGISGGPC